MTRRRVMFGLLAIVVIATAWWLLSDGLSAEERRLVGTWWYVEPGKDASQWTNRCRLEPDRRCLSGPVRATWPSSADHWWSASGGILTFDPEPSGLRRAVRPIATFLGYSRPPAQVGPYELNGDRLLVIISDHSRHVWVRMSPDWMPPAKQRNEPDSREP